MSANQKVKLSSRDGSSNLKEALTNKIEIYTFNLMKCFEKALQRGLLFLFMDAWTNPLLGHSVDECSSGSSRPLTTEVLGLRVLSPAALQEVKSASVRAKIET